MQGSFHYDREADALVFKRTFKNGYEEASIPLPHPNIQGKFSVFYCWGQTQAVIGNEARPVVFKWKEKRIA